MPLFVAREQPEEKLRKCPPGAAAGQPFLIRETKIGEASRCQRAGGVCSDAGRGFIAGGATDPDQTL